MKRLLALPALLLGLTLAAPAGAEEYTIDTKGAHAFIEFKIAHLGYSWLLGRFNTFSGSFSFDEKSPAAAKIAVEIDTASIDSNHAERDKHLRSPDFLDVTAFPKASFVSTRIEPKGAGKAVVHGNFTLHGVTRPIAIEANQIGAGKDPWGGFRRGFEGRTTLKLADYNIAKAAMLGPAAQQVQLYFSFEGVRQ